MSADDALRGQAAPEALRAVQCDRMQCETAGTEAGCTVPIHVAEECTHTDAAEERAHVESVSLSEFECALCADLLHHPVSAGCGHTFCRACLLRAIEHASCSQCPLCRAPVVVSPDHPVTVQLAQVIRKLFPSTHARRCAEEAAESAQSFARMPAFLIEAPCFPGRPVQLLVFEPRYRLMIRRCLAGARCFVVPVEERSCAGVVVRIDEHAMLPDGRSILRGTVTHRALLDEWDEQDGYAVCRVHAADVHEDLEVAPGDEGYDEILDREANSDVDHEHALCRTILQELFQQQESGAPTMRNGDGELTPRNDAVVNLTHLNERLTGGTDVVDATTDSDTLAYFAGALSSAGAVPRAILAAIVVRRSRAGRIQAARCCLEQLRASQSSRYPGECAVQ